MMRTMKGTRRALWGVLLAFALASACQKNREVEFTQGDGENLYSIGEYQGKSPSALTSGADLRGKTFTVTTGKKRFKGQTSRADAIEVLDGFHGINSLDAVEFEIKEGLFSGFDLTDFYFYGRENHEYTMEYSFTDHFVILSKIAARDDLPSQELTFAEDVGSGLYRVPVAGLPISLFTVERIEDGRGKRTRRDRSIPKDYLKDATHFKVSAGGLKYFAAPAKPDMLKADFFKTDDEWFYTKTLVGRAINSDKTLGEPYAALKIKFARTNNSILGVDLNIAEEQTVLDPTKTIVALEIPVEWVDFKTAESGVDQKLVETKLSDETSGARFWQDRQYALVDFNNADRLDRSKTQDNKLEKLEIGDNYISFRIYESTTGDTYKYSLAKDNRKIQGQPLLAFDKTKFHIFYARKSVINGQMFTQDADFEKIDFANRMYPVNNEILFYLTDNSPNDPIYRNAAAAAIKAWDDAFAKAGTNIHVRLADNAVALGDVRYNQIAYYGYEIDSGSLLGFGPSVQDTRTGETFSASTHIYLRTYREGVIRNIRSYIRNELGVYEGKEVKGIDIIDESDAITGHGLLGEPVVNSASQKVAALLMNHKELAKVPGLTERFKPLADLPVSRKVGKEHEKKEALSALRCEFGSVASSVNNWQKITNLCLNNQSKLSAYLVELKSVHDVNSSILNLSGESDAILDCAQKLMPDLLTSTLIHEIGHNFGLGHNFAASSDGPNHARGEDGKILYPSSSVMDYPDRDFDLYSIAGPYDVAAIRFLYGRKVQLEDESFVAIGNGDSIKDAIAKAGKTGRVKLFRMCTDYENNDNSPIFDPMCLKWDVGSTPSEYVTWAISKVHSTLVQNGYLVNNKTFRQPYVDAYFLSFKQIYEYWRYLIHNYPGLKDNYLGTLPADQVDAYFTKLVDKEAAAGRPQFKQYYDATKKIYEFSRDLIFYPIRVCVVDDGLTKTPIDFMEYRSEVFVKDGTTIQDCFQATPYLAEDERFQGRSIRVGQFGHNTAPLTLDLDPSALADKIKQVYTWGDFNFGVEPVYSYGFQDVQTLAAFTLMEKTPTLQLGKSLGFYASFLDSQNYQEEMEDLLMIRVLRGIDGKKIGIDQPYLANFKQGQDIQQFVLKTYINNADAANKASQTIGQSFSPIVTTDTDVTSVAYTPDLVYRLNSDGFVTFASLSNRSNAYHIMRHINVMRQARFSIVEGRTSGSGAGSIANAVFNHVDAEKLAEVQKAFAAESSDDFATKVSAALLPSMADYQIFLEAYQLQVLEESIKTAFVAMKAKGVPGQTIPVANGANAKDEGASSEDLSQVLITTQLSQFIRGGFAFATDETSKQEYDEAAQLVGDDENFSHQLGDLMSIIE